MTDQDRKTEQEWEPMRLTSLGSVGQVIRIGHGKLTTPAVDPGEPLKTKPSG
jgi:hypothetical protein